MGMMSRALKGLNFEGVQEVEPTLGDKYKRYERMSRNSPPLKTNIKRSSNVAEDLNLEELPRGVMIKPELIEPLERMATERGIGLTELINIRLQAMVFSYDNCRTLSLRDPMPFGQYKGIIVEDMIRADARYTRWLYSTSEIFELDDAARVFLEEMS